MRGSLSGHVGGSSPLPFSFLFEDSSGQDLEKTPDRFFGETAADIGGVQGINIPPIIDPDVDH